MEEDKAASTDIFDELESNVRIYSRSFPRVFARSRGSEILDETGKSYIDFFCGAGALNYGHAHPVLKERLLKYIEDDGIVHALDMSTPAKRVFLRTFRDRILAPRGLKYKIQFAGPTGANAVEAALKISRRVTKRTGVFAFSGAFHGMTLGSASVTANLSVRAVAGLPLGHTTFIPFADGPDGPFDSIGYMRRLLADSASGVDVPAAVIVEPVQMDGGVYEAPVQWLRDLRALCDQYGIVLICDDIQAGCGRTGTFFGFERAGIVPDIVTMAKSVSGFGLPLAILLLRPEIDQWKPGAHTGTFRANQLALVAGTGSFEFWSQREFLQGVERNSKRLAEASREVVAGIQGVEARVVGMVAGIDASRRGGNAFALRVQQLCFQRGLILELCGRDDCVLKVMPALTIPEAQLQQGMEILRKSLREIHERASAPD